MLSMTTLLIIALAPLLGAVIAGLFGRQVGRTGAHAVTIGGVAISCLLSCQVLYKLSTGQVDPFNQNVYTFFEVGGKTPPAPQASARGALPQNSLPAEEPRTSATA